MNNYYNALVEVDTILDYLLEEDYNKIPKDVIEMIKENKSKDYKFEYDPSLDFENQKFLKETESILYYLFREFLASPEQREKLLKWEIEDTKKEEQEKAKNYNYKDVFPKKEIFLSTEEENSTNISDNQLIEYKGRLFNKIKNWFINLFSKR